MKKSLAMFALMAVFVLFNGAKLATAQEKATTQRFEYAMIKWDGPDRIQYMLPDRFELARLGEKHPLPRNAQPEEFYLTIAANELAKQGWEALNIDSRRILFRRPVSK